MSNIKIKIKSPEHSEFVQKVLLERGYKWVNWGATVKYTGVSFLFIYPDGDIAWSNCPIYFNKHRNEDVSEHPDFCWPRPKSEQSDTDVAPFEVGKFYKTRSGERVVYIGENTLTGKNHMYVFGYDNCEFSTNSEGFARYSDLSIIGEWQEEKRFWVAYKSIFDRIICDTEEEMKLCVEKGYQVKEVIFNGEEE